MSDWDFTWGLKGDALIEAQSSGATDWEWKWLDGQDKLKQNPKKKFKRNNKKFKTNSDKSNGDD